jgi:hypothetical protein
MYKCSKCDGSFEKYKSLSLHMYRTHDVPPTQFYVDYYLNGVWPLCKCGCGKKVKWNATDKKFRELCKGHYSRIHNNWGHNQKAIDKSSETRRIQFASGERTTWNNGLTIDDPRVRLNSEKTTFAINSNPLELKRRSDLMHTNRLNGIIPTLHGSQHSQWKGGASSINVLVRARVKLYKEWKYPILIRDGFKCVQCGATTPLHVHHDKEQMCEIIQKHLVDDMNPKTFEEKEMIADAVVDYHINNKVSGITLCGRCHEEKHPSLNF